MEGGRAAGDHRPRRLVDAVQRSGAQRAAGRGDPAESRPQGSRGARATGPGHGGHLEELSLSGGQCRWCRTVFRQQSQLRHAYRSGADLGQYADHDRRLQGGAALRHLRDRPVGTPAAADRVRVGGAGCQHRELPDGDAHAQWRRRADLLRSAGDRRAPPAARREHQPASQQRRIVPGAARRRAGQRDRALRGGDIAQDHGGAGPGHRGPAHQAREQARDPDRGASQSFRPGPDRARKRRNSPHRRGKRCR